MPVLVDGPVFLFGAGFPSTHTRALGLQELINSRFNKTPGPKGRRLPNQRYRAHQAELQKRSKRMESVSYI